jgi:hypothetical protein
MARSAEAVRQLPYHLHAHEPLSKSGVLDQVFEQLQREQIIRIRIEAVHLDSTTIEVHPDAAGALKKTDRRPSENPRRLDNQDSYGCRECSNGHKLRPVSRAVLRFGSGTAAAGRHRTAAEAAASDHGPR